MKRIIPTVAATLTILQESRPVPQPAQDEVQVSIQATGLCGSDLHYYAHGRNGNFVLQHPLVLGHEASGIVTAVPSPPPTNGTSPSTSVSSTTLQPGDRVALEVGLPCRTCPLCQSGRYNLCPNLRFKSSAKTHPHLDGTLQTTITHPANLCHKLPSSVTYAEGALVEPLAVSLHAINRSVSAGSNTSTPLPGSSALIIGAGAVGILTAIALSVSGVSNILIVDIDAARLDIAATLSQSRFRLHTYLLPRTKPPAEVPEQLAAATDLAALLTTHADTPLGFDRVFECTGLPSCVQLGIFAAGPGAKLVLVGMGNPVQTLPLGAAALREVDIVGVFRYAGCYPAAIALFASGQLQGVADALVTHRVRLEEGERAFRLAANAARDGEDEGRTVVKVVVVP